MELWNAECGQCLGEVLSFLLFCSGSAPIISAVWLADWDGTGEKGYMDFNFQDELFLDYDNEVEKILSILDVDSIIV